MMLTQAYPLIQQGKTFLHPQIAGARLGIATRELLPDIRETMLGQLVLVREDGSWSTYDVTPMDLLTDGWVEAPKG